ncbi:nitroreductase family protein [Ancylobacter sp.]|uniref:nitroreductase family protein n=1 Tax=Ancylobacter sp. TaxID=1872567 RepID=UPI003D10ADAE
MTLPTRRPPSPEMLALLEARRSVSAAGLGAPGPDDAATRRLLEIAARVPDHAMLVPWRFIVIDGAARGDIGALLAQAYRDNNPEMAPEKREKFAAIMGRLFPAPLAVVVVSRPVGGTMIPDFEQELSAGAVCMNLLSAATAMGFDAIWVTGWVATHPAARAILGLGEGERVAGLVHVGTAAQAPGERPRPDVEALTTRWSPPG